MRPAHLHVGEASLHGPKEVPEFHQERQLRVLQRGVVIVLLGLERRFVLVVNLSPIVPHLLPLASAAFLVEDQQFAALTQGQVCFLTLEGGDQGFLRRCVFSGARSQDVGELLRHGVQINAVLLSFLPPTPLGNSTKTTGSAAHKSKHGSSSKLDRNRRQTS